MAKILLAEDDKAIAGIYKKWLESAGHYVAAAADGARGFEKTADQSDIDLLVTDMMMPEMSGEELASAFNMVLPNKPVIVVTASGDMEQLKRMMDYQHVCEVLKKPVSCDELLNAVDQALDKFDD